MFESMNKKAIDIDVVCTSLDRKVKEVSLFMCKLITKEFQMNFL